MKRQSLLYITLGAAFLNSAAVTPLWMRDVTISPDGSKIAFTYRGDIYTVPVSGGEAKRLTTNSAHESSPIWSPDGTKIAFASDRNGGKDIFIMPSTGGEAKRITWNSAAETPETFTPDGRYIVFSAVLQDPSGSAAFPTRVQNELYQVSVEGGPVKQISNAAAVNVKMLGNDGSFVFEEVTGLEDKWRKHHTSSVARDLWLFDASTSSYRRLTDSKAEDRNPIPSTDGKTLYFLSERNGSNSNIYSMPMAGGTAKQLTDFTVHPVRFLSVGADGTMAFTYDGEIYTMRPDSQPKKLDINVTTDITPRDVKVGVRNVSEAAVSPSGKQIAFTNRGEVFSTSVQYPSVKQITETPQGESSVSWGKDERSLYYASQRGDGALSEIYRADIAREGDPNFSNATLINETVVVPSDGVDRTYPIVSPDGKKIAYLRDRTDMMVRDLATGKEIQLTDTTDYAHRSGNLEARWSPDSRWIVYTRLTPIHDPYSDIAVVNVETGEKHLITNTGYFDMNPRWVMDGQAILFLSERYGMRNHASWGSMYDVMITFLTQDAYDKFRLSEEDYELLKELEKQQKEDKKKADEKKSGKKGKNDKKDEPSVDEDKTPRLDFTNLDERTIRLTPASAAISDAILTKDGSKLFYLAKTQDNYDLWKKDLRKGDVSIAAHPGVGAAGLEMDNDGNFYIIGSSIKKFEPTGSSMKPVTTSTTMKVNPVAEREYMYDVVVREERERFYDPAMHGVDWDRLTADYARFLPHIDNNYDFAEMLSELLGELNVSHTGGRYYGPSADETTGDLGLLYDLSFNGSGLKVDEIVSGGPFDRSTTSLKPGSVITSINGVRLDGSIDPAQALNGTVRQKTLIGFTLPDGTDCEEVIVPITSGSMNELLYQRWLRNREADVDRLSNGRLGYVHIRSMDDESFRKIYAKVMGEYKGRDGIVIDTRWNGGGRLHEDIEVLFSGEKYLHQYSHGVKTAEMPSRRWNKPSIMIIGEANYSNAHGTPWVYKHKNLGKLVGMPVPGTMTSVNWVRLQDNSLVFGIPVTGYKTAEGNYLENSQIEPDIKVANTPDATAAGEDTQLVRAVEELLKELD